MFVSSPTVLAPLPGNPNKRRAARATGMLASVVHVHAGSEQAMGMGMPSDEKKGSLGETSGETEQAKTSNLGLSPAVACSPNGKCENVQNDFFSMRNCARKVTWVPRDPDKDVPIRLLFAASASIILPIGPSASCLRCCRNSPFVLEATRPWLRFVSISWVS